MKSSNSLTLLFVAALALIVTSSSPVRAHKAHKRSADHRCCYPDQFNGELTLSRGLQRSRGNGEDRTDLKFAVDMVNMRLHGEHTGRAGRTSHLHHVQFLADMRPGVNNMIIREKISNRCWQLPSGEREAARCALNDTMYRGELNLDELGRTAKIGLLYAVKHSTDEGNPTFLLPKLSLLLTDKETCLPIMDMDAEDLGNHISFRDMAYGLGEFENPDVVSDECANFKNDSPGSEDFSSTLNEGLDISQIIKLDIYLYLLRMFFPKQPSTPCCGPQQWQASLMKNIAYTNSQIDTINEAVTSVPQLYVDHLQGKMAANVVEYIDNVPQSNLTFLAIYGSNLVIYAVDWKPPVTCVIITVTDVVGPMRSSCMPPTAQYSKTVRVGGGGPLDSIRLDVWNTKEVQGNFNFTGETYVSPRDCVTVMETYSWKSQLEKVWGTVVMSNIRTSIADPAAAFAVPSACSGTGYSLTQTAEQLRSEFATILSFSGK